MIIKKVWTIYGFIIFSNIIYYCKGTAELLVAITSVFTWSFWNNPKAAEVLHIKF